MRAIKSPQSKRPSALFTQPDPPVLNSGDSNPIWRSPRTVRQNLHHQPGSTSPIGEEEHDSPDPSTEREKKARAKVQMILQMNLSSPVKRKPRETFENSIERIAIDEPGRNEEKEEEETKVVHLGCAQEERPASHSTSNASQSQDAVAKRFATERKADRHRRSVLIDLVRINYRQAGATAASANSKATATDSLSPPPQKAKTLTSSKSFSCIPMTRPVAFQDSKDASVPDVDSAAAAATNATPATPATAASISPAPHSPLKVIGRLRRSTSADSELSSQCLSAHSMRYFGDTSAEDCERCASIVSPFAASFSSRALSISGRWLSRQEGAEAAESCLSPAAVGGQSSPSQHHSPLSPSERAREKWRQAEWRKVDTHSDWSEMETEIESPNAVELDQVARGSCGVDKRWAMSWAPAVGSAAVRGPTVARGASLSRSRSLSLLSALSSAAHQLQPHQPQPYQPQAYQPQPTFSRQLSQVVVKDPLSIQNIPRPQVYKNVQASKQMSQAFSKSTAEQPPFRPTIKRSLSR